MSFNYSRLYIDKEATLKGRVKRYVDSLVGGYNDPKTPTKAHKETLRKAVRTRAEASNLKMENTPSIEDINRLNLLRKRYDTLIKGLNIHRKAAHRGDSINRIMFGQREGVPVSSKAIATWEAKQQALKRTRKAKKQNMRGI